MLVVTVLFRLKPGCEAGFLAAIRENATKSLELEPGCHQFDVATNADGSEVYLYEVYTDQAAFGAHTECAHFKTFDTMSAPWVAEKTVALYDLKQGLTLE